MIRTLIVDDELLAIKRMEIRLQRYPDVEIIGNCSDGDEAISTIVRTKPDLVFLDIDIPGMNGLAVADHIVVKDTHIIFVTAFNQYAIEAFDRHAIDYLLKPVSVDRLDRAMKHFRIVREQTIAQDKVKELSDIVAQIRRKSPISASCEATEIRPLWIRENNRNIQIDMNGIEWVEAARDYLRIHMVSGRTHFIRRTMADMIKILDTDVFFRIHRSTIIRIPAVREISNHNGKFMVGMRSGNSLRVGRTYQSQTRKRLTRFLKEQL